MNYSVSVIVPNYNGCNLLKINLPKVVESLSEVKEECEIIVVDDFSSDGSIKFLEEFKAKSGMKIKIIKNNKNLGFSSAVNKAVSESENDILVLLNTDVSPKKDFLEPLLKHFIDPVVFAVGCMDESRENGKTILRGRGIGTWKKGFLTHSRGEIDKTNTLWVNGGSGAFRKSIWNKLGGLDNLYSPFYWEDIDLSYRALKSGYKIYFEPKSIVIHEHEKGAIRKTYSEFQIKTIAYRNQFIFVWKNATDLSLQFSHFLWLPYHFINALLKFDFAFFIGLFSAVLRLPKIISSSFQLQKYFVKTDSEVILEFAS